MPDYRGSHQDDGRGQLYDARYKQGSEAFFWSEFERPFLLQLFFTLGSDGRKTFLDFATGTGRILELAVPHFAESTAIDISASMIERARAKAPSARFLCTDVTQAPPQIGPFDVVSAFRFLLNAEPELSRQVLCWIRSVIRDNGTLVINNHLNAESLSGVLMRLSNRVRGNLRHKLLSESDLSKLLEDCGFRINYSWGFGVIPGVRGRLLVPRRFAKWVEERALLAPTWMRYAKDRIYLCRPI